MQAVILAGGVGTRLKPITDYIPKSLIPINNVPIIEWQIKYLKKYGINDVVICTGYKAEQIQNYLKHKDNFGIKIKFSVERSQLGTAGAIKKASSFINKKSFFVLNGDVLTSINPTAMSPTSIALVELQTKFGTVSLNGNKIIEFNEKKPIPNVWMNAGVYCLDCNVLKDLPKKGSLEKDIFPNYAKKGLLKGVKFNDAMWFSIDSHKDIQECSAHIKEFFN